VGATFEEAAVALVILSEAKDLNRRSAKVPAGIAISCFAILITEN
jgi:hypothetical protein